MVVTDLVEVLRLLRDPPEEVLAAGCKALNAVTPEQFLAAHLGGRHDIQDAIIAGTLPLTMVPYLNTSFVDAGNACLTASATLADFVSRTLAAHPVIPRANVVSLAAARARR